MIDRKSLKEAAERAKADPSSWEHGAPMTGPQYRFIRLANPTTVLELLDENERLKETVSVAKSGFLAEDERISSLEAKLAEATKTLEVIARPACPYQGAQREACGRCSTCLARYSLVKLKVEP